MVTKVAHALLRYAEQMIPARTPILSWEAFWEYLEALPQRRGKPVPRPTGHNPDRQVFARVDDGRWIADCPWGCGSAFNLPQGATWFWCTECAGGGLGLTAVLVWPDDVAALEINLSSLPVMLQFWPCVGCRSRLQAGTDLCESCQRMKGVPGGHP